MTSNHTILRAISLEVFWSLVREQSCLVISCLLLTVNTILYTIYYFTLAALTSPLNSSLKSNFPSFIFLPWCPSGTSNLNVWNLTDFLYSFLLVSQAENLGITHDASLSFTLHIQTLSKLFILWLQIYADHFLTISSVASLVQAKATSPGFLKRLLRSILVSILCPL